MKRLKTYSPYKYLCSKQLNLSDFGLEPVENCVRKFLKDCKNNIKPVNLFKFIEFTFNTVKMVLNDYSSYYSNHIYTQPKLFTILAIKIYTNCTYRELTDLLELSDKLKDYLGLKKIPHFTTIQKFFKRIPTKVINDFMDLILSKHELKCEIISMDGTGFTNDYADKYYAKIRNKERKSYVKYHATIDVETRLILHQSAQRGPRYDTKFALAAIRGVKKYKPHYILADRAYDTELIRKCINEETGAFDQIPIKTRAKTGHYRLNSPTIFRPVVYSKRNNSESVFSVMKRKFDGTNHSMSLIMSIKETKLKGLIYNIYRTIQIS